MEYKHTMQLVQTRKPSKVCKEVLLSGDAIIIWYRAIRAYRNESSITNGRYLISEFTQTILTFSIEQYRYC